MGTGDAVDIETGSDHNLHGHSGDVMSLSLSPVTCAPLSRAPVTASIAWDSGTAVSADLHWPESDINAVCGRSSLLVRRFNCNIGDSMRATGQCTLPFGQRSRQASEVWRGQSLLATAIGEVKRQTQPDIRRFLHQLEVIESYLRSIREILRGHNAQADFQDLNSTPTLSIQTVQKLFSVYSSFLRGKVNLFVSGACQGSGT
ncbi:uncharacterized protein LOC121933948 [Sceloporus undulatus]|uniref:uncharacterized protein LOC121933948 n=1 Tax=Sceloporus undulatus TaxID=8520 RepID=UPI001C4C2065|nr:uncharacterized protein LOC121933948 [Sceloporus undulatus]